MTRAAIVVVAVAGWAGATLLLAELRWFRRPKMVDRLRPYAPAGSPNATRPGVLSLGSLREVLAPFAQDLGGRLARLVGVHEDVAARLERIHAQLSPAAFRLRQLGWAAAALAVTAVVTAAVGAPPALALGAVLGAPVLAFLVVEQRLASQSAAWQRAVFLELPVVSEQLGMLLAAGYSLGAGLNRLATRGHGRCPEDLELVCGRMRQGLGEIDALHEWAARVDVVALDRLVAVLALNREAGDLSRLITEEARVARADAHRELIETIERRGQQVWIPVTVATLLPGVAFLAVPFIEAMRLFTSG